MAGTFLGNGWRFKLGSVTDAGLGLDAEDRIAEVGEEDLVRQSIWLILSTAPGERVARPDFGCGIHDLVFATGSAATIGSVTKAVSDALARWEPRIEVLGVSAAPDAAEPELLLIEIQYSLRATNSRFNLVYPFYLS